MTTRKDLPDVRINAEGFYREELFTDRRVGVIRQFIPVRADGSVDGGRRVVFEGQTSLLTSAGPLPFTFEIEANTLADAIQRFPGAAQGGLEQTLKEIEELRREAASPLIVPGRGSPGIGDLGGSGTGGIRMP
jgi:hypothetical protein